MDGLVRIEQPDAVTERSEIVCADATAVQNGYGACSSSGCNCPAYSGQAQLCENCGHNYATHW